jgi:hypothetical protein
MLFNFKPKPKTKPTVNIKPDKLTSDFFKAQQRSLNPQRFKLYKTNSQKQMRIFLVFCIVMTVLGLAGLISELGFNYRIFNLQTTVFITLAFQGAFGVYIARNNLDNNKYFVSWDEKELNYHLPNMKEPVIIRLSEISKIEREPQKIRIELKTGEAKYFSFTYFYFPTRTTILDFFEELGIMTKKD